MDRLTKSYFLLSSLGIAVAAYHAYDEVTQTFNACNINSYVSCGGVFASGDTSLFGVPLYVLGLVWFPLTLALGLWLTGAGKRMIRGDVMLPVLMVGSVFTLYLWYLELGVIRVICPVCVSLYAVNYAMTLLAALAARREPQLPP